MTVSACDGFVDLQVNGFRGVDFSSPALTVDDVLRATEELAERGTIAFCPTVITCPMETYRHVLPVLAKAHKHADGRLLGVHLEGPFLSPEDGAIGTHPRAHARDPDLAFFDELDRLADGRISVVTLAPERPGAERLIENLRKKGKVVAIGHTSASAPDIRRAVAAGATLSTHLGNGCPLQIHRHNNSLWPQLAETGLSAMLITDGVHLPEDFIRTVLLAKTPSRVIVTSDAAPIAGLAPGHYEIFGTQVVLKSDGRVVNPQTGTFAGSAATMKECMKYLASITAMSDGELRQVGFANPLRALGLDPSTFAIKPQ